ncbi:immune inhibitor A, partial [Streptomyces sp. TRM76130]|nr:immune inhibitor A [Streptomyces sp. TRM76130]
RTDGLTLHKADVVTRVPSAPGVSVFNDHTSDYYDPSNPTGGVRTTDTNTKITITKEARDGSTIALEVGPAVK